MMNPAGRIGSACVMVVAASALLFGPGSAAWALDLSEWVPGLRLTPFLSQRVEYETNVFQVPSGEQDDVIFWTIPGFVLDYSFGPHTVSAAYRAEILNYLDLTSQNTVHHIGVGQLRLEFPRTLVTLRDDYIQTSEPPTSELTGKIDSITNILAPAVEYRVTERLAVGLNPSWTWVDYGPPAGELDRNEYLVGPSVFWKFWPTADVVLNYSYGEKIFDDSERDVTRHIATVGLRGDVTAKLSSSFRIGVEHREPKGSGLEDFTGLIMGGDFVYKPTDRTTITLVLDRSPQESVFGTNLFYISTVAALAVRQQLTPKLAVTLRGAGGENDYSEKETVNGKTAFRNDTLLGGTAGVEYAFREWLRLSLQYAYARRDSNFSAFDYTDHKVSGAITVQF
jgi:Putative beta-barrel porin 2